MDLVGASSSRKEQAEDPIVRGSRRWVVWLSDHFELPSAHRIPAMEGARGLAVILVFFVHYYYSLRDYIPSGSPSFYLSNAFERIGHSGVDIFFVLSGYLIYGAVRSSSYRTGRFLQRRAVRIYPAFLAMVCVYVPLSCVVARPSKWPGGWAGDLAYLVENVLLLPGIFNIYPLIYVAWSLSYEALFYLLLPLLMIALGLGRRPKWVRLSVLALGGLLYGAATVRFGGIGFFGGLLFPAGHVRLLMFLGGIFLYEIKDAAWMERFFTSWRGSAVSSVLFLGGLMLPLFVGQPSPTPWLVVPGAWEDAVRTAGLFAGCSAFVASCLVAHNLISHTMSSAGIRWLGNMSYSYYLSHSLVVNGVGLFLHQVGIRRLPAVAFWTLLPMTFSVTLLTSGFLFLTVEKPFSISPRKEHRRSASSEIGVSA